MRRAWPAARGARPPAASGPARRAGRRARCITRQAPAHWLKNKEPGSCTRVARELTRRIVKARGAHGFQSQACQCMPRVTRTTRFLQCTVAHTAVWQRVATRGRRAAHDRDEWLHVAARAAHQQHERQARHVRRRDVGREARQRQPVPRRRRRAPERGRQPPQRARAPVGARDVAGLGQAVALTARAQQVARAQRLRARALCSRSPPGSTRRTFVPGEHVSSAFRAQPLRHRLGLRRRSGCAGPVAAAAAPRTPPARRRQPGRARCLRRPLTCSKA